jgi:hypothetical protein
MYHIGNTVCEENQIPLPFYIPLIRCKKRKDLSPLQAQTGLRFVRMKKLLLRKLSNK